MYKEILEEMKTMKTMEGKVINNQKLGLTHIYNKNIIKNSIYDDCYEKNKFHMH